MRINKKLISKSINYYGKDVQTTVCMEECAELIQSTSKLKRYGVYDTSNLAEEMADALICIEIRKQVYSVTDAELQEWIDKKQGRIDERMV